MKIMNKMAINTYLSTTESKKSNKQNSNTTRFTDSENILTAARWEGVGGSVIKDEGIKKYRLVVSRIVTGT